MLLEKLLIFGGKGGVGKSTLACALSVELSSKNKTLLVSLDPAHSLSGILGREVREEPTEVLENLYAVELCAERLSQEYTRRILEGIRTSLSPRAQDGFLKLAQIVSRSPTSLETAVFDKVVDFFKGYPYVVLDFAPTGNMLRFFQSVQILKEWLLALLKLSRKKERMDRFMGRETPVVELIERRLEKVDIFDRILKERAVIFAVALPEELSFKEAQSILESFKDFRVYLVINRWRGEKVHGLKVPYLENPYGVDRLKLLDVRELLSIL